MTEIRLEVELPPRPIGTLFPLSVADKNEAEIIGHRLIHDTDTQETTVMYRASFVFRGRRIIASDETPDRVEAALGGES